MHSLKYPRTAYFLCFYYHLPLTNYYCFLQLCSRHKHISPLWWLRGLVSNADCANHKSQKLTFLVSEFVFSMDKMRGVQYISEVFFTATISWVYGPNDGNANSKLIGEFVINSFLILLCLLLSNSYSEWITTLCLENSVNNSSNHCRVLPRLQNVFCRDIQ